MIKGVNRQMVVVKLDGGAFDSACFILRRDAKRENDVQKDILYEANRSVAQLDARSGKPRRRGLLWRIAFCLFILIIGVIIGFALSLLV